jgi:hypothetical protein
LSFDEASRSLALFVNEVMPRLKTRAPIAAD